MNETTLFQFQWGYRRKGKAVAPTTSSSSRTHVRPIYFERCQAVPKEKILEPKAAYGYWRCVPEGDTLVLLDPKDEAQGGRALHASRASTASSTSASPTSSACTTASPTWSRCRS